MSVAHLSFVRPAPPAARRPSRSASRRFQIIAAVALLVPTAIGSIGYVQASGYLRAVATTGSDANPGTEAAPWRTIGHALAALSAGDTLVVHGGTYVEHVAAVLHAGTASAPIVVRAASGERPIVKGLLWLTNPTWWTFDGLNVTWDAATDTASQHMVRLFGGSNWTFKNAEVWGAHSFADILVGQTPSNWRITANCIHDTYATNSTNQDHNIYVNSGLSAGPGSIDHNIMFNATNGRNIKLGGPSISDTNGTQNVSISYNTLYNANQNVSMSGSSRNNTVDHNILGKSLENHLIYGYSLFGTGNVAAYNVGFASTRLIDGTNISDGGGNVFPRDPRFDGLGCGGFHPADATAQAYGAYAGGAILPGPIPTPTAKPVVTPTATAAPTPTLAPKATPAATPSPAPAANPLSPPVLALDATRPTVKSRTPAAGTRGVARGVTIRVVISEPVTGVTYRTARLINLRTGHRVAVRVSYNATTRAVRIDPTFSLRPHTWYRVSLLTGIHDQAGNPLVAASWRFLTR
jgi:hypothetical protein